MNAPLRYLTYTPWHGQLNNTRMCFETALVLAFLSQRILVTPKAYRRAEEPEWEDGQFRPINPDQYFALETLKTIVRFLPHDEYRRDSQAQLDTTDLTFEPGTAVFCFPAIPFPESPEARQLHEFAAGRQRFLAFTPRMQECRTLNVKSPTLEHFYSFFYFTESQHAAECKRLVRDHLRFRPEIMVPASRIAGLLAPYYAMHVRRTDFIRQFTQQNISSIHIFNTAAARIPPGSRLYISTDEPDKSFFSTFRRHYEVYFLEDFAGLIPSGTSAAAIACIEQMVCSLAELFMGTRLSTFSGYITRLRGYYGAADTHTYFTDGSPGSEMDSQGSPSFSWTNWLRSGNPLWGREYKEAWELS